MLFAVRFHDKPDHLALRATLLDAHIAWLQRHQNQVLAAGSLRPDPDAAPVGGLWIVQATDKAEIETLLQSDPFWRHGLRERVEIHSWHRAFPEPVLI